MDMMWKKDGSGLYIDVFEGIDTAWLSRKIELEQTSTKNDEISTKLRQNGNDKVNEGDWYNAMTLYNRSLRYARIDSENVSLAIANRSYCFLKLKMYDECLVDIELAIDAKYPQRLMHKLTERRGICLERMNKPQMTVASMVADEPKLDFAVDKNFRGMADVMKMESNEKFGKHFISKCDIGVGKVLMVEEAFVASTKLNVDFNICDACFANSTNFIACPHCANVLFCSQTCAENILHKIRCGKAFAAPNGWLVEFILRSIVLAINMFTNIEALCEFIETVTGEDQREVPHSLNDIQSKYRLFLKFARWAPTETYLSRALVVFYILKKTARFHNIFNGPNAQRSERFLMHLCVLHTCIVECNSFDNQYIAYIFPLSNHFNHSCAPNVLSTFHNNKSIAITSRRIKKGDQLFISYGETYFFKPLRVRQTRLYSTFGFLCGCEKCRNERRKIAKWPISSATIKSDPMFKALVRDAELLKREADEIPTFISLKKKCIQLLTKYSSWCTELDTISHLYQDLSIETLF